MRLAVVVVALLASSARAGGLAEAIARHAPADVETLRAQLPGDVAIRCALGAVYARRGDLSRAGLYLAGCDDAPLPADIGETVAKLARETAKKLGDSDLSVLEIITKPAGMTAEISALPGDALVTPATVWVPAGSYEVVARLAGHAITNHVTTAARSRSVVFLEDKAPAVAVVKPGKADFTDEAEPADRHEGPPPAVAHPSLMSAKLRGVVDPAAAGPQLDDPFALVDDAPPSAPARTRFGVRAGSGVSANANVLTSPIALSLGLEAHFAIAGEAKPLELVLRIDYLAHSGRGSFASILGTSAGVAQAIAAPDAAWLSAGVALHAINRHDEPDHRDGFGLTADALLELALRRLPVVVAARFEQGLTATDERALLLELGYDFRSF